VADSQRFTFDGSEVYAQFVDLGGDHEELLANYLEGQQPQVGSARVATVVSALHDKRGGMLKIDGKKINFMNRNKPFPRKRDEETGKSLLTVLLEYIVTVREPWLANHAKYDVYFADYLVDDDELAVLQGNPTTLRATSSGDDLE
jgi:hypothetical protein